MNRNIYDEYLGSNMSKRDLVYLIKLRDLDLLEMKQARSEDFQFLYYIYRCLKNGTIKGLDIEIKEYMEEHKL